ncbi:MAG: hypothetical protein A2846_01885 [Candidatus Doudnabacteria bacterium RIFCSPHIGHO2_01_FULL_49_9]|uniref:Uncharacterized protein n=1 Tax=Candidatus Doudnabacteria bacterium RIFCSPHIGHO2_01_FULL_49_9 TaxID=1817827 RepID=A0A1F5P2I4_9BACT|nr:MAG: hypothetical protein A2846_01885 [Candidatus Doudnabacteria bacterium RIFCSPHIGHO2_01_FULL_49_9]
MRILEKLIKATLKKYNPTIIGISGSVGKSVAKGALEAVFESNGYNLSVMGGLANTQTDMERALLGFSARRSLAAVVVGSALRLIFGNHFPRTIILEYPLLGQADLRARLKFAKPDILVLIGLGELPFRADIYENQDALLKDIAHLVQSVSHKGTIVINGDDKKLMELKPKGTVVTFGFGEGVTIRLANPENRVEDSKLLGVSFKLEYQGSFVPVRMDEIVGKFYAYAAGAASAVGLTRGLNLVKISEGLSSYRGEPGKSRLLPGIKNSWLIDDTYDSSWWGVAEASKLLGELPGARKIAVLGDILDLGVETESGHIQIGRLASKSADVLITVGPRAKFIAEGAKAAQSGIDIYSFDESGQAGEKVQEILKSGDLVLIKGSKHLRMEDIVLELMAEPEKASELLVRR